MEEEAQPQAQRDHTMHPHRAMLPLPTLAAQVMHTAVPSVAVRASRLASRTARFRPRSVRCYVSAGRAASGLRAHLRRARAMSYSMRTVDELQKLYLLQADRRRFRQATTRSLRSSDGGRRFPFFFWFSCGSRRIGHFSFWCDGVVVFLLLLTRLLFFSDDVTHFFYFYTHHAAPSHRPRFCCCCVYMTRTYFSMNEWKK
ncbi:hypothetical protein BJV74DRAFT_261294 [Russula compacta]|nr:hypothetical protein BJV74DRAFT_261294 [Russula compacta]